MSEIDEKKLCLICKGERGKCQCGKKHHCPNCNKEIHGLDLVCPHCNHLTSELHSE